MQSRTDCETGPVKAGRVAYLDKFGRCSATRLLHRPTQYPTKGGRLVTVCLRCGKVLDDVEMGGGSRG